MTSLTGTRTLTIQASAASNNTTYAGWVRAYGADQNGAKATRPLKFRTAVSVTEGGTTDYVDILGFAVFEVTSIDSSDMKGKAITGWFTSVNDPILAIGKKYGLVPRETD